MKSAFLFLFSVCFFSFSGFSQCPDETIWLLTQADVDSMPIKYPSCSEMPVQVNIRSSTPPIADLSPLSYITRYDGGLSVSHTYNDGDTGFENVTSVDGLLSITGSGDISGIELFTSLERVNRLFINTTAASLVGPSSLEEVDHFTILGGGFEDIQGFDGLTCVDSSFNISSCNNLINITGFNSLLTVAHNLPRPPGHTSRFSISFNDILNDISGFNGMKQLNSIYVTWNPRLMNITGFNALKQVDFDFLLFRNDSMQLLDGMSVLDSIGWEFGIINNGFTDLNWLNPGLDVRFRMLIENNPVLTSLSGTQDLGNVRFSIYDNPVLVDCAPLCQYMQNATNPIVHAGENGLCCSSREEIESACYDFFESTVYDLGLDLETGQLTRWATDDVVVDLFDQDAFLERDIPQSNGAIAFNTEYYEDGVFHLDIYDPANPDFKIRYNDVWDEGCNLGAYDFPFNLKNQIDERINVGQEKTILVSLLGGTYYNEDEVSGINYELYKLFFTDVFPVIDSVHDLRFETMRRMLLNADLSHNYEDLFLNIYDARINTFLNSLIAVGSFYQQFNRGQLVREKIIDLIDAGIANGSFDQNDIRVLAMAAATNNFNRENEALIDYYAGFDQSLRSPLANAFAQYLSFGRISSGVIRLAEATIKNKKREYALFRDTVNRYLPTVLQSPVNHVPFNQVYNEAYTRYRSLSVEDSLLRKKSNDLSLDIQHFNLIVDRFTRLREKLATQDPKNTEASIVLNDIIDLYKNRSWLTQATAFSIYANVDLHKYADEFKRAANTIGERNRRSALYPAGYLQAEAMALGNHLMSQNNSLTQFRSDLTSLDVRTISASYYQYTQLYEDSQPLSRIQQLMGALSQYAFADSVENEVFINTLDLMRISIVQQMTIHGKMSAFYLDTSNISVLEELQYEIDTLQYMNTQLLPMVESCFNQFGGENYSELVAVSGYQYIDSLTNNRFQLNIELENFGPLSTLPFEVKISPTPNVRIIDNGNFFDSLTIEINPMSLGEQQQITLDVSVQDEHEFTAFEVVFNGVYGLDKIIPIVFKNIDLAYSGTLEKNVERHLPIRLVPNPAASNATILSHSPISSYKIYSSKGVLVQSASGINVAVESLQNGVYFLLVILQDGRHEVIKFSKV